MPSTPVTPVSHVEDSDRTVTLDAEQHAEIAAAIETIAATVKKLVASGPGHEQTAMAIGTSLATIHATLCRATTDTWPK